MTEVTNFRYNAISRYECNLTSQKYPRDSSFIHLLWDFVFIYNLFKILI